MLAAEGAKVGVRRIMAPGFAFPEKYANLPGTCLFSPSELPAGGAIRFIVTPRDCFGGKGRTLAIDVGDHADIHPKDKKTVGERLARLALARAYGLDGVVEAGPIPQAATLGGDAVSVTFKNAKGLSTSDGGAVSGFQLVAADGQAVWADASLSGETVSVAVPEGFAPAKVRFAWDDYPVCNLVNGEGLPCGPFELEIH